MHGKRETPSSVTPVDSRIGQEQQDSAHYPAKQAMDVLTRPRSDDSDGKNGRVQPKQGYQHHQVKPTHCLPDAGNDSRICQLAFVSGNLHTF